MRIVEKAYQRPLLTAYLATLLAIVVMTITGAVILYNANFADEMASVKATAAVGFIGAAISGLIGVIGAFLTGLSHQVLTPPAQGKDNASV